MNLRPLFRPALLCCVLLTALHNPVARALESTNLVANGDFSQRLNGQPEDWETAGDTAIVTQTLRVLTDADGKRCAQLSCSRFERQTPSAHAMLAQVGRVHLTKGRTYQFSCQLREEGIAGRSVSVAMSDTKTWQNCGLETAFPLSPAWHTYRCVFQATRDVAPSGRLQIWFTEVGTLYVADVRITPYQEGKVEFTDVVPHSASKNLVPNASFELGGCGWSSLGMPAGWGNLSRLHGRIETSAAPQGHSFLRIPIGGSQTPVLYFDYYQPVVRREVRPLVANEGWIRVQKGTAYTLSCYMRASRADVPAVLGVTTKDPAGGGGDHRRQVKLTTDWRRYSFTFTPRHRYVFVFAGPGLEREQRVDVDVDAIQLEKGERATAFEPHQPVELALEPSEPGGIFFDHARHLLWLRLSNYGEAPVRLNVKFHATDFYDQPAALPNCLVEIPARSAIRHELELPATWRGYYRVSASAQINGTHLAAQVRLAIVPRPTGHDSVLGINHAFATADLIHLASKAGVTWYRDWSLKWQHIEPAPGQYHWQLADTQIDRVLREGCSVLPLLPPFPSADWSSEAPLTISTKGYPAVRARQAWAPKDPRKLAQFIQKAVARYKDRIHIWEFLNEPVYTDYSLPAKPMGYSGGTKYGPGDYVALLRTASTAMRQADPACTIIGGIAGGPLQMTATLLDDGIFKHVDDLNLHIYPGLRAPEAYLPEMDQLLKDMDAHGRRKPIWITEFSYYGADNLPRQPFVPQPNAWAEARLLESERQCADYTTRFFAIMLSHGVQKIFIHAGANGSVNESDFECALFDYGGVPRKLFPALAVLTHVLGPSPRSVGMKRIGAGAYAAGFETGKHAVLLLWRSENGKGPDWSRLPSERITWMDAMGRSSDSPPANLSGSLTYLLGRSGTAAELLPNLPPTP